MANKPDFRSLHRFWLMKAGVRITTVLILGIVFKVEATTLLFLLMFMLSLSSLPHIWALKYREQITSTRDILPLRKIFRGKRLGALLAGMVGFPLIGILLQRWFHFSNFTLSGLAMSAFVASLYLIALTVPAEISGDTKPFRG